jgi:hypothetical protein
MRILPFLLCLGLTFSFAQNTMEQDIINVEAKDNVSLNQLVDELTIIMRTVRRLKPVEEEIESSSLPKVIEVENPVCIAQLQRLLIKHCNMHTATDVTKNVTFAVSGSPASVPESR